MITKHGQLYFVTTQNIIPGMELTYWIESQSSTWTRKNKINKTSMYKYRLCQIDQQLLIIDISPSHLHRFQIAEDAILFSHTRYIIGCIAASFMT